MKVKRDNKWDDLKIWDDFLMWADRNEKVFNTIDIVWRGLVLGAMVGGILYFTLVK